MSCDWWVTYPLLFDPSSGPLWAVCLPDLRSSPLLLPHLHILPGARDTGQDFRPDRSKLQRALGRGNDGYGHGHGPGQAHGAGLLGGGKHELKTPGLKRYGPEYSLGWTLNVGLTPNLIFWHVFWSQLLCSFRFWLKVCFGIALCFYYHCNMEVNGYELSLDKRLNPVD